MIEEYEMIPKWYGEKPKTVKIAVMEPKKAILKDGNVKCGTCGKTIGKIVNGVLMITCNHKDRQKTGRCKQVNEVSL